jgi:hypothetical protein
MTQKFFESCRLLGSSASINVPFAGIILKWLGVEPVGPKEFKTYMTNKDNLVLLPGGFEEASLTDCS